MADGCDNAKEIVHVDMDAFFASVEQRDHPEWRGKPVIVGAPPDKRGVVSTCSYEARKFGVRSAMPSRTAYRLCPHGIFVPGDHARYEAVSREVMGIFDRFTPIVEQVSIDEAYLDVTGSRRLFGDGMAIGTAIRKAIREELSLTASVGVGPNKFLAKICSELAKPDGIKAAPSGSEAIAEFLAPLPVGSLYGVGKVAVSRLGGYGIKTVRDLQRMPLPTLETLFGKAYAAELFAISRGVGDDEVATEREEKSISREHTFGEDCSDREFVRGTLRDLVDDVGRRLRAASRWATVAKLKLRWSDFTTITRQMSFPHPVRDDFTLWETALALFEKERLVKPVRLIGFGVGGLAESGEVVQGDLFEEVHGASPEVARRKERLSDAIDAIRSRLGDDAVRRG